MFGKFIFPQISGKPGENDKPTSLAVMWKLLARYESLPANMEENKNLYKHGTHWAVNILCVRRKNWQGMVRKPRTNYMNIVFANKMFANVYAALCECTHVRAHGGVHFNGIAALVACAISLSIASHHIWNSLHTICKQWQKRNERKKSVWNANTV